MNPSGRARLALLASVAVTLGLLVPTAGAAAATITLSGSTTASIDVVLAERLTVDLGHATFSGKGRFVGFYADRVPAAPVDGFAKENVGAVAFRDFHGPGGNGLTIGLGYGGSSELSAGPYRIYLLTEGPATVTLPVSGSVSYRLRPTRKALAAAAVGPDIRTSAIEASSRLPLAVAGKRSITISALLLGEFRAFAGSIEACVAKVEEDCGSATRNGIDSGFSGFFVSPLEDYEFGFIMQYEPGVLEPKDYEAVQGATVVTTLKYAAGAALTLDLT